MKSKKYIPFFNKGFSSLTILILLAFLTLGVGIGAKDFLVSYFFTVAPSPDFKSPDLQILPTPFSPAGPVNSVKQKQIATETAPLPKTVTPQTPTSIPKTTTTTSTTPKTSNKVLAFALASASSQGVNQLSTLLDNTSIDGVALQIGWPTMEISDEVFSWTVLDSSLKAAKDRNKKLTIHVFAGAGLKFAPWLKTAGVQTYTFTDFQGRTREDAIPWDKIYIAQYTQFLKSLAAHLSSTGYSDTIARISVAVPVPEMDLIACKNNLLANTYPYDRATYLATWETMIDAYASSFPSYKKFVSAPVGLICYPNRDTQFFSDVMNYASGKYGTSFVPFAADLTSEGSDRMKPYSNMISSLGVGYQTIWSATNDPSLRMKGTYPTNLLQAVCKAKSGGADYIEIYGVDVLNTDSTIQKAIKAIHDSSLCN